MEAFTVTIPQLAGAIPVDPAGAQMQLSAMPDLLAGLGAVNALRGRNLSVVWRGWE